jgi:toxin FitB
MFLLDTNVLSELRKVPLGKANRKVALWASSMQADVFYLSAITIYELEIGILRLRRHNAFHSAILNTWMKTQVIKTFDQRILAVDTTVAKRCAALQSTRTRPWADALIAATAVVHGMTLVTRNVSDFHGIGAPVLNPWLE